MGFAVVDVDGKYAGAFAMWMNPPRELRAGESVVVTDDPSSLPQRVASVGEVTNAQMRLWLIANYGSAVISQVDAMVNAMPDATEQALARAKWEYGSVVRRSDPLVAEFAEALGLDSTEVDAAFLAASQIS